MLDDFTTIELARDAYGVVFADERTLEIDAAATEALRAELRSSPRALADRLLPPSGRPRARRRRSRATTSSGWTERRIPHGRDGGRQTTQVEGGATFRPRCPGPRRTGAAVSCDGCGRAYEQVADQLRELRRVGRARAGRSAADRDRARARVRRQSCDRAGGAQAARSTGPDPHGERCGRWELRDDADRRPPLRRRCAPTSVCSPTLGTCRWRSCSRHANCSRCRPRRLAARRRRNEDIERLRAAIPRRAIGSTRRTSSSTTATSTRPCSRLRATSCSRSPRSPCSTSSRRASRARISGRASTARSTPITARSSRPSRPATTTPRAARCTTTSSS